MTGITLGSSLALGLARAFEKTVVERVVSPQMIKKFDYLIGNEGMVLTLLLFLIPGLPKDGLCYILGLTRIHFGTFLLISTLGRVPGTLLLTLQGAKAFNQEYQVLLLLFGVSLLTTMVFYVYREKVHGFILRPL